MKRFGPAAGGGRESRAKATSTGITTLMQWRTDRSYPVIKFKRLKAGKIAGIKRLKKDEVINRGN